MKFHNWHVLYFLFLFCSLKKILHFLCQNVNEKFYIFISFICFDWVQQKCIKWKMWDKNLKIIKNEKIGLKFGDKQEKNVSEFFFYLVGIGITNNQFFFRIFNLKCKYTSLYFIWFLFCCRFYLFLFSLYLFVVLIFFFTSCVLLALTSHTHTHAHAPKSFLSPTYSLTVPFHTLHILPLKKQKQKGDSFSLNINIRILYSLLFTYFQFVCKNLSRRQTMQCLWA